MLRMLSIILATGPLTSADPFAPEWVRGMQPGDAALMAAFEEDLARLGADPQHDEGPAGVEPDGPVEVQGPEPELVKGPPITVDNIDGMTVSIGRPDRGWLIKGKPLQGSAKLKVRKGRNYGTPELIEAINQAVDAVHAAFPKTPKLVTGDLSRAAGGKLRRHLSHQSGRDADIGYYFKGRELDHFRKATRRSLDVPRTWAFMEALLATGRVEYMFVDHRLQKPLYTYAKDTKKLPAERLLQLFQYPRRRGNRVGIIRHSRGHADHLHLRVFAPRSVAAARVYIEKHGVEVLAPLPVYYRIRRGDSLARIARKHRCRIKDLTRWNRMSRRKTLRIGKKLVVGWRRPKLPGA